MKMVLIGYFLILFYSYLIRSTKTLYIKKLDELKVVGNPIEKRQWEQANRSEHADNLKRHIESCKSFASEFFIMFICFIMLS